MSVSIDPRDLYKSIILRESLPLSFRRDRASGWARALAPIGESDNQIGGLFGKSNFYGETAIARECQTAIAPVPILYAGGLPWSAVLSSQTDVTFAYTLVNFPIATEVRDNQKYDTNTLSWIPAPGITGMVTNQTFAGFRGVDIETLIAASSTVITVKTPDPNGTSLLATVVAPVSGVFTFDVIGQDRSAIQQARDAMLWDTATGKRLTSLGANFGVPRPPQSPFDDELFRKIGQILAWLPKTPLLVTQRLAEAIFGLQSDLITASGYAWQIYEVNPNEIIFECPVELIAGNPAIASYLHGFPGNTGVVVGPTNTISVVGSNAGLAATGGVNGRTIYIFFGGVWNTYSIVASSYNSGTSTNLFNLNLATVPSGNNYPVFIDIPEASSFRGDFMMADATVSGGGLNPPTAQLVYLYGQGRLDILTFYINGFTRAAGVLLRVEVI